MIKIISIIIGLFIPITSISGIIYEVYDLKHFEQSIEALDQHALVLLDIDYTVLSPADNSLKPCGKKLRVKYLHGLELKRREWLQSIIALDGKEMLLDEKFPALIRKMQEKKVQVIGFTALETGKYGKIDKLADWRLKQLKRFSIDFSFAFKELNPTVFSHFSPYNDSYPIFKNGVLFTNRHAKGAMFRAFIERRNLKPKTVVMVDDSRENLMGVETEAQALGLPFIGFYYRAAEVLRFPFDEGLGNFQFQYLIENERWLSEVEAKKAMSLQLKLQPDMRACSLDSCEG